jgi:hypothetical protein
MNHRALAMRQIIVHTGNNTPSSGTVMLLQEVQAQAFKLPPSDRLILVTAIIESLQDTAASAAERSNAIQQMRGLLKTNQPAPTDEAVAAMLADRREEKFL